MKSNKKLEIFLFLVSIIGIITLGISLGYNLCCLKTPSIVQWILGVCGTIGFIFGFKYI
ncbi:hypothetical protein IX329_000739 [Fusobacterium necrophorum]|nr:hypothetical protein [Fusobacterium necrophorum]MBR8789290.1 hypothetical protein [Fusobacterium necrophorum]